MVIHKYQQIIESNININIIININNNIEIYYLKRDFMNSGRTFDTRGLRGRRS